MVVVFVLLFVGIAIALAVLRYRARQARIAGVAAVARSIGFTFSPRDTERLVDMPFVLFGKGERRGIELVITGIHNGVPMRMFDYWYYDETSDGRGDTNRRYHRFTCALATIPAACPRLQLGHENVLTRLGDHLGLKDVEFEYDDFNRRFRVKCADQKFAFSLFDGKMMQWLMDTGGFDTVEVDGPWILIAGPKLDPRQWLGLGSWLDQFHNQIPPVVYSIYPPR